MSISTPQGGSSRPNTARPGGKPRTTGATSTTPRPAGSGGPKRRPPIVPVKVAKTRNWMPIIVSGVVGLVAIAIIAYAGFNVYEKGLTWQDKADKISGIVDYREKTPSIDDGTNRNHVTGTVKYAQTPPVAGNHNPNWQRCLGDVYNAPIANENAVHSLEHGAVWITYQPNLPASQIAALTAKVKGNNFMLMSPYPGQDSPISLQAWGFQLKVSSATDPRIDDFVKYLRQNASMEPGVDCASGQYITATGTDPHTPNAQPSAAPSS